METKTAMLQAEIIDTCNYGYNTCYTVIMKDSRIKTRPTIWVVKHTVRGWCLIHMPREYEKMKNGYKDFICHKFTDAECPKHNRYAEDAVLNAALRYYERQFPTRCIYTAQELAYK